MSFEIDGLHEDVGGAEPLDEPAEQRGRGGVDGHGSILANRMSDVSPGAASGVAFGPHLR
jgi:hypothetical protein